MKKNPKPDYGALQKLFLQREESHNITAEALRTANEDAHGMADDVEAVIKSLIHILAKYGFR